MSYFKLVKTIKLPFGWFIHIHHFALKQKFEIDGHRNPNELIIHFRWKKIYITQLPF